MRSLQSQTIAESSSISGKLLSCRDQEITTCINRKVPLYQTPRFLEFSAQFLSDNQEIIKRAGHTLEKIDPLYFRLSKRIWLPLLRIVMRNEVLLLVPTKNLLNAVLSADPISSPNRVSLRQLLDNSGLRLQPRISLTGWELGDESLFSIFNRFPDNERFSMAKNRSAITLETKPYSESAEIIGTFYQRNLQRKIGAPFLFTRNADSFFRHFLENFKITLVKSHGEIIGAFTYVEHLQKIHFVEIFGDEEFYQKGVYEKALYLQFFQAKNSGITRADTNYFDWCIQPFLQEILRSGRRELSSLFQKMIRWKLRKLDELPD